jgi:transcriptional regulator with XRE-family HTH domain
MFNNKITGMQLGEMIGVSYRIISNYKTGRSIPTKESLRKIYNITKAEVSPNDFYNFVKQKDDIKSGKQEKRVFR